MHFLRKSAQKKIIKILNNISALLVRLYEKIYRIILTKV